MIERSSGLATSTKSRRQKIRPKSQKSRTKNTRKIQCQNAKFNEKIFMKIHELVHALRELLKGHIILVYLLLTTECMIIT